MRPNAHFDIIPLRLPINMLTSIALSSYLYRLLIMRLVLLEMTHLLHLAVRGIFRHYSYFERYHRRR